MMRRSNMPRLAEPGRDADRCFHRVRPLLGETPPHCRTLTMFGRILICTVLALLPQPLMCVLSAETIRRHAKDTLTALEMKHGDTLAFQLRGGRTFTLALDDTDAAILEKVTPGGIVYQFRAHVRVDGQPMTLHRYVCTRECFHQPYVIDGVRIWLDTVKDVFDLIPIRYPRKGNLQCLPRKDARIAIQEAALRICPEQTRPWIEDGRDTLDVAECYNGDDCYLGPYLGQACHVGLDVNHPKGSTLTAPIDFDTQAYFNSLKTGHNNNRWRGIRRWSNGDAWALQSHHLIDLLVPPNTRLAAGTRYATTAGVHIGSHEHTHFEFKIGRQRDPLNPLAPAGDDDTTPSIARPIDFDDESARAQAHPEVLHLDPWILFWQIFEDRHDRDGRIRAAIQPVGPARTGQGVAFSAEGSRAGAENRVLNYHWTFGDGTAAHGSNVVHTFAKEGVYPVSLVVDDGLDRTAYTQHVVVHGHPVKTPVLALVCRDEPSFRNRRPPALDTYGREAPVIPHTAHFVARPTRPRPQPRVIELKNIGGGALDTATTPQITYEAGRMWLNATPEGQGNHQALRLEVDAAGLAPGEYHADVAVTCGTAATSHQDFHVRLTVPAGPPPSNVTIDNEDPAFFATPYFWVGHRFCRCPRQRRGYNGFYLTNGCRPAVGEYARFVPDLDAGTYGVSFCDETPFLPHTEFDVRVRCRSGDKTVRVAPAVFRLIGEFEFEEGADGFVEIRAAGSRGLVIADGVQFTRK